MLSFGDLRYTDSREHSDMIHEFCGNNYGILGKTLAEYLISADPDKIIEEYEACKGSMRNAVGEEKFFDLTERLVNEYALILLAARALADIGMKIDSEGITAILVENHDEVCERSNIAEKYYNHLITYSALNPFLSGIKKDESNNTVAFVDELFLRILEKHGASNTDLVIKELDSAGYIFRRKQGSIKNRLRFNGALVNCYELFLPKDDFDADEGCLSLEYVLTNFEGLDDE